MKRAVVAALWMFVLRGLPAGQFKTAFPGNPSRDSLVQAQGQSGSASPQVADPAQTPASPAPGTQSGTDVFMTWGDMEKDIWRKAHPYLDENPPELEQQIPELKGLDAAPDQDSLPGILKGVGDKCVDLLQRMPNVIADEEIKTSVEHIGRKESVGYLVVVNRTASELSLKEYRTDKHGSPVANAGAGQGFASMWVRFFPPNQRESRFKYLGKQKVDGHPVLVVAFAQIPDKVKFPGSMRLAEGQITILYQGIAWIDPVDWRILREREDLLAPRPDANLSKFSAQVRFGGVTIKKASAALWLPKEADLEWVLNKQSGSERHIYSNYRLYAAKSKIVLTP